MNNPIFLYRGVPCQIVRHPSDSLIEIINPDTGRHKTVPSRDVVTMSQSDYYRTRSYD
jgi:hypothetical protein